MSVAIRVLQSQALHGHTGTEGKKQQVFLNKNLLLKKIK